MTSLSDVYEGGINTVADPRQRRLGGVLFALGAVMVTSSITIATTSLAAVFGLDVIGARATAGVLAGLGVPAVFVGLFVVLPATDTTRAAAAIGASLTVFGVIVFSYAYPDRWLAADPQVALATIAIYALGTLLTLWSLFISVATFNRRNAPGGTARIEITEEGNVRVVSAGPETNAGGSVGLFGSDPHGDVPTQTNTKGESQGVETEKTPRATSDGSGAIAADTQVDDEILEAATQRGRPDRYCGNCEQFKYVKVEDELRPYCALDEALMEDMDACEQWSENA